MSKPRRQVILDSNEANQLRAMALRTRRSESALLRDAWRLYLGLPAANTKPCLGCGEPFAHHRTQQYCTPVCRRRAKSTRQKQGNQTELFKGGTV